MSTLANKSYD